MGGGTHSTIRIEKKNPDIQKNKQRENTQNQAMINDQQTIVDYT